MSLTSIAVAVPIHKHEKVPIKKEIVIHELVRGDAFVSPDTVKATKTVVDVIHVAPVDEDDDGIADVEDNCVFCTPVYASSAGSGGYSGDGTTDTAVDGYAGSYGSTVMCESGGDYGAYDSTGTYWGGWQFDQQTWDAYAPSGEWGSATPAQQDAAAAAVPYDAWPNC